MFKHYIRFLLRKQALFTALNLTGLIIGITAALLLFGYVRYEQQYDRQSPYAENIWRVFNQTVDATGKVITQDANTHNAVGPTLKAEVPGVLDFARLYCSNSSEVVVLAENQALEVARCYTTDPGFLRMFPQKMLRGDSASCLNEPYQAILTQTQANRIYGTLDALGKTFRITRGMMAGLYTVSAVVADPPANTHLKYDVLLSYATQYANGRADNFESYWDYNYFQLAANADPELVRKRLAQINETILKPEGIRLEIQRFTDIHLHSDLSYELEPNGNAGTVRFLSLIALLILGIAFINFVNLATAFANERGKEVGVRKAIGASRGMLVFQFFMESLLLSLLAFVVAIGLAFQTLPRFGAIIDRPLAITSFDPVFWGTATAMVVLMAMMAALYPALQMSGFRPAAALRGRLAQGQGAVLRKALVITQFACSVGLVFGVLVVSNQVDFLKNHALGADIDQILTLKSPRPENAQDTNTVRNLAVLKTQAAQMAGVQGIASSSIVPAIGINGISGSNRPIHWTQKPDYARITSYFIETDEHFFELFGIKVLAGNHRYHADRAARFSSVSINQSMMKALGFPTPELAIGQQIAYENSEGGASMTVAAVIEDFHIESLKSTPKPTLYYCFAPEELEYISLKIKPENQAATLGAIQQEWLRLFPKAPFRYWFLDAHFARQYHSETQFGQVFGLFAALAMLISCLGLLSLTAYNVQHRRKEIGIRKVLGGTVTGITLLLVKDYLQLIFIAFVLAAPIAFWLMQQWLSDFAYRIDIQAWMFVVAGLITALVAFFTLCFQSFRAALLNPVKSLRNE